MNPLYAVHVILNALGRQRWFFVVIISLAIAAGVSMLSIEHGVRKGSAKVSNMFDLIVTAPGSKIDSVLNLVYLQNEVLEPLTFADWFPIMTEKNVQWSSPIVKGDFIQGYPIIGVKVELIKAIYGQDIEFESVYSAVVGSATPFSKSQQLLSQHGLHLDEDDDAHHSQKISVQAVLPKSNSPWDKAILVPVEQLWAVHGLAWHTSDEPVISLAGNIESDDAHEQRKLLSSNEWLDLSRAPAVIAVIVKPSKLAAAYSLRTAYSTNKTMAFFPAEVLVRLYSLLGNARDMLKSLTAISEVLVMLSVLAGLTTWMQLLTPQFALIRALGATRLYLMCAIWLALMWIMLQACIGGLLLGLLAAYPIANLLQNTLNIPVVITLTWTEVWFALGLLLASSLLACWPAYLIYKKPLSHAIRVL